LYLLSYTVGTDTGHVIQILHRIENYITFTAEYFQQVILVQPFLAQSL